MSAPVAVCYFGITRSLRHTIDSIQDNILAPIAEQTGQAPRQYAHFFQQAQIDNPRTGETGQLDTEEHRLLDLEQLELETPDTCLELWDHAGLKAHGDAWGDGQAPLRNLVHQLHSLDRVTDMALQGGAQTVVFIRPDLLYHDSLAPALKQALSASGPRVWLPWWQAWFGMNDRFAICRGRSAIETYGRRIRQAHAFCEVTKSPMHAERLVEHVLSEAGIPVTKIGTRASRVRAGGEMAKEEFLHPFPRKLLRAKYKIARLTGLRALSQRLRGTQTGADT